MKKNLEGKELYEKVYDILVTKGGAPEDARESFVYNHSLTIPPAEWRFCGYLGFGGKYRFNGNLVTCYLEDVTPERSLLIEEINIELGELVGIKVGALYNGSRGTLVLCTGVSNDSFLTFRGKVITLGENPERRKYVVGEERKVGEERSDWRLEAFEMLTKKEVKKLQPILDLHELGF